jgi:histone-lysine N-methyltransferase SETMAR
MLAFKDPDIIINAQRYCGTFRGLRTAIKRECPSMLTRGVIVLHDMARPHAVPTPQDTLCPVRWKVLGHTPYIPDLSPRDFMRSALSRKL